MEGRVELRRQHKDQKIKKEPDSVSEVMEDVNGQYSESNDRSEVPTRQDRSDIRRAETIKRALLEN
jgi:hypothetical protein